MMHFYMTPGSCSTGIHILLEELELVFSATILNLPAGDQHKPAFRAINPKGTIPVLVLDDGTALTSYLGICWWLATNFPQKHLLPDMPAEQAKALDLLGYIVNTLHGTAFTRIFTPEIYCTPEEAAGSRRDAIVSQGRTQVSQSFELIENAIAEHGYCLGDTFSAVDSALFYVEFWADRSGIELPDRCKSHFALMKQRPSVRQVLAEEGYRL